MNRLKQFREDAGLSQTTLAGLANTSGQQIGRLERADRKLTAEWAARLAPHLGRAAIELLFDEKDISDVTSDAAKPIDSERRHIIVIGAVQAGEWREALEWPLSDQYSVNIYDDRYPHLIGLEVRGDSMNKIYPANVILICRPFDPTAELPPIGKRVVVQRQDKQGMIEATVKEFIVDDYGQGSLVPASTNPDHKPIPFKPGDDGNNDIEITAIVVGSYKKE